MNTANIQTKIDDKLTKLYQWLTYYYPEFQPNNLQSIASAASMRIYYRLRFENTSQVVMVTNPDASFINFIKFTKLFDQANVCIPKIAQINHQYGFILMSDLGERSFLYNLTLERNNTNAVYLYQDAIAAILKFQSYQNNKNNNLWQLPIMDRSYINKQLIIFKTWFLQKYLQLPITNAIETILTDLSDTFSYIFQVQPTTLVHLDYHSDNLIVTNQNNPGILDFQDAMLGPITYDLVSLLQDAYIIWDRKLVLDLVKHYFYKAVDYKFISTNTISLDNFIKIFDLTGVQRHIKNLGIFARLHYRDNKSKFLNYIPNLLSYLKNACNIYPELFELNKLFTAVVDWG